MFGLDDLPRFVLRRRDARARSRRRGSARPPACDRPGPPRRGYDADRVDRTARARRRAARARVGRRSCADAVRPRRPDRALPRLPARDRPASGRDGDRLPDRGLAVWLLLRWRRGAFHAHAHEHGPHSHAHLHSHRAVAHEHPRTRTPLGAFTIGLLHGVGGSAGVGILLVSTIDSKALAVGALGILAAFTALSMTLLTTGFGLTLARGSVGRLAPALGAASLAFGLWYALGAQNLLPYYF